MHYNRHPHYSPLYHTNFLVLLGIAFSERLLNQNRTMYPSTLISTTVTFGSTRSKIKKSSGAHGAGYFSSMAFQWPRPLGTNRI